MTDILQVSEVFTSIQGEGPDTGVPVIFVRLARCNLQCRWCDTPYAVFFTDDHPVVPTGVLPADPSSILHMEARALATKVLDMLSFSTGATGVVLTGGEPLVQQKLLIPFLAAVSQFVPVQVETNGTIVPDPEVDEHIQMYNVSPKLLSSGNTLKSVRRPRAYEFFVSQAKRGRAFFKFVVTCDDDLEEIHTIVRENQIPHSSVYLMPEGVTQEKISQRYGLLVHSALTHGFRVCNRLQITIWGDRRGV